MRTRIPSLAVLVLLALTVVPASAQEGVTLVVWDNFTREAETAMIDALDAQFMEANPAITIQRETYTTEDLTTVLPTSLTESTGPDVAMINQGFANMGALVSAGLLLPLNDYADQYDWWSRYAAGLHARNSFSEDGTQFGVGNLYGVSNTAEVVAVFYWREDFEALGLEVPQTLEEFEAALAALKDAGSTPIMFGSLDGWPAIHTLGAIQHSYATVDEVDAFTFRLEGGTYDTEANLLGAQKFVDWISAGYFPEGFEGMDYDNATMGGFINHEASTWITGSWAAGNIIPEVGEEAVGFFLFPPAEEGQPPLNIGGVGLAYGIRATSEHPDEAAAYIDIITGPDAGAALLDNGFLPAVAVDESTLTEGTLTADIVTAWNTISSQNAVGHYWDWTIPDMAAYIQELIAGQLTPEQFIDTVEADYTAGQ
jgi:raffinose/stachyose/melibiose transport system substrate-binding protein